LGGVEKKYSICLNSRMDASTNDRDSTLASDE
jgi:hypothetical protein